MNVTTSQKIFEELIANLDIPDSAYERVEARYKDLGAFFKRPESLCARFDPDVYPQGSFRLGTVNRPLNEDDEYDLDLGCRLRKGVTKSTHTQKNLKELVGADLADYRKGRQIERDLEEKHRCWRLRYSDELNFHMDTVPSIPEDAAQSQSLVEAMVKAGSTRGLATSVSAHAGAITDNRLPNYNVISPKWRISNSEGYALWFESRIKQAMRFLERRALILKAQVDDLPARRWKAPLQQVIQILKRHRDVMFLEHPEAKPISIIITTLAGEAYRGEENIVDALRTVLTNMDRYIRDASPRVPNPVNPLEDFADKWGDPAYKHLHLEQNFRAWLAQARADFESIVESPDDEFIRKQFGEKFGVLVTTATLKKHLGMGSINIVTSPKTHNITETPPRPWRR
jgi:cyclic GMP-AMP synthase DncV-like protein